MTSVVTLKRPGGRAAAEPRRCPLVIGHRPAAGFVMRLSELLGRRVVSESGASPRARPRPAGRARRRTPPRDGPRGGRARRARALRRRHARQRRPRPREGARAPLIPWERVVRVGARDRRAGLTRRGPPGKGSPGGPMPHRSPWRRLAGDAGRTRSRVPVRTHRCRRPCRLRVARRGRGHVDELLVAHIGGGASRHAEGESGARSDRRAVQQAFPFLKVAPFAETKVSWSGSRSQISDVPRGHLAGVLPRDREAHRAARLDRRRRRVLRQRDGRPRGNRGRRDGRRLAAGLHRDRRPPGVARSVVGGDRRRVRVRPAGPSQAPARVRL